jgi:hypothetical protein
MLATALRPNSESVPNPTMNNFGLSSFIALLAIAQGVSHRHYQRCGLFGAVGVLKVNYETTTLASFPWRNEFSCQRW